MLQLEKLMCTPITIGIESTIADVVKIMLENNIGSLGIASDEKDVIGIITKTDLVRDFAKTHQNEKTVGEYMSTHYSWVYSDILLNEAVSKMLEGKISRVIVKNKEGIPVGIITFRDLFNLVISMGAQRDVIFPKSFESEQGLGKTLKVDEVMKNQIITVGSSDDLAKACQLLLKINGVGVLSDKGNLIGILSKTDIIKAIASLN